MKREQSVGSASARTVWMGNAAFGGILALLGGVVCCVTLASHIDYLVFGQRLMGFYLGMAVATLGASSTIFSVRRIR